MILSTHVSSSKTGGGTKSLEGLNLSLSERYVHLIVFILLWKLDTRQTVIYNRRLSRIIAASQSLWRQKVLSTNELLMRLDVAYASAGKLEEANPRFA